MAPPKSFSKLDQILGQIEKVIALIGSAFICIVIFLTLADVLMRWFWKPIVGVIEYSQFFIVPLIWLGMGYTLRIGGHVRMEMLSDALFRGKREIYYWICTRLLLFIFVLMMCISAYEGMCYSINCQEYGDITEMAVYPFKMIMLGGCIILILEILTKLVLDLFRLKNDISITV